MFIKFEKDNIAYGYPDTFSKCDLHYLQEMCLLHWSNQGKITETNP